MDTADHQQPVRRVPWIGGWGFFGISWFALLALLFPAFVGGMQFAERHTIDHAGTTTSAHRTAFVAIGVIFITMASALTALIAGFLTYVVTVRRWYTPPTTVFALAAMGMAVFWWLGFKVSNDKLAASNEARANLERMNSEHKEVARRQLETDGYLSPSTEESDRLIQGLRDVAETSEDPNKRAVYRINAEIGERINELVLAYNTTIEPFVTTGVAEIANDATEEDLLGMIDILEQSMDANGKVIAYFNRIPAILKIEFANRTKLNAATRAAQANSILKEMNHANILDIRNAEQRYLEASREQAMVLLDTHGLWENTPDGFLFFEGVNDRYIERFNAAFQTIQEAIADQTSAQGRIYNTTPAAAPADEASEPAQP